MDKIELIGLLGILGTLAGALFGAWLGGRLQYNGAISALKLKMEQEEDERIREKQELDSLTHQILVNFLLAEIDWNYNVLGLSDTRDFPLEHSEQLSFNEFNQAKYLLVKNPNRLVREVIKLYDLLQDLPGYRLSRNDPRIRNLLDQILAQKQVIEGLTAISKSMTGR